MRVASLSQYETSITFYNKYLHLSQKYTFATGVSVPYVYVPCWGWQNAISYIGLAELLGIQNLHFDSKLFFLFGGDQKIWV